jgi:hypothetical protein
MGEATKLFSTSVVLETRSSVNSRFESQLVIRVGQIVFQHEFDDLLEGNLAHAVDFFCRSEVLAAKVICNERKVQHLGVAVLASGEY